MKTRFWTVAVIAALLCAPSASVTAAADPVVANNLSEVKYCVYSKKIVEKFDDWNLLAQGICLLGGGKITDRRP